MQGGAHTCAASNSVLIRKWKACDGWCFHDMTSSEAAVLTAWGKTGSWWGLQAHCTHTYRADSAGAARCSGHWQFRLPDFWSCSEESLLPLREDVQMETAQLWRHNLIYIQCIGLPWLIMAHEGVLRVPLHITGRKKIAYIFLSVILTNEKRINHLHMTVGCETHTLLFAYWLHTFFF